MLSVLGLFSCYMARIAFAELAVKCTVKLTLPLLDSMRSGFLQQFLAAWERELLRTVTQKTSGCLAWAGGAGGPQQCSVPPYPTYGCTAIYIIIVFLISQRFAGIVGRVCAPMLALFVSLARQALSVPRRVKVLDFSAANRLTDEVQGSALLEGSSDISLRWQLTKAGAGIQGSSASLVLE